MDKVVGIILPANVKKTKNYIIYASVLTYSSKLDYFGGKNQ